MHFFSPHHGTQTVQSKCIDTFPIHFFSNALNCSKASIPEVAKHYRPSTTIHWNVYFTSSVIESLVWNSTVWDCKASAKKFFLQLIDWSIISSSGPRARHRTHKTSVTVSRLVSYLFLIDDGLVRKWLFHKLHDLMSNQSINQSANRFIHWNNRAALHSHPIVMILKSSVLWVKCLLLSFHVWAFYSLDNEKHANQLMRWITWMRWMNEKLEQSASGVPTNCSLSKLIDWFIDSIDWFLCGCLFFTAHLKILTQEEDNLTFHSLFHITRITSYQSINEPINRSPNQSINWMKVAVNRGCVTQEKLLINRKEDVIQPFFFLADKLKQWPFIRPPPLWSKSQVDSDKSWGLMIKKSETIVHQIFG